MSRYAIRLLLGALLLALALTTVVRAQPDKPTEYQIKAAFLYNFAKFTDWGSSNPAIAASQEGGFVLCVAGKDPFGSALAAIEGKLVQGQRLRIRLGVSPETISGCHMLFVSESEERRAPVFLKAVQQHPVLTVSDIEGFTDAGGMIGLVVADSRIQFDINLAPANRVNLKVSSQLLSLARSVSGGKGRN
ncbi:MAG: YfiR family protein [Betaproteobacteria bacterium]|nr:YfiR family protein [Betaproteobacteria bacterium]